MKKTPLVVGSAIGLTVAFYMAAYYLLPGDPPSAGLVGFFAAVALGIVWAVNTLWSRKATAKEKPQTPGAPSVVLVGTALLGLQMETHRLAAQVAPASSAPTITCSASPSKVMPGGSATITAVGSSPEDRPLHYSFSVPAGEISGSMSTATLSTVGARPGVIVVTCNVVDDRGLSASTTTTVEEADPASLVESAPLPSSPPPAPPPVPLIVGDRTPPALDRVTGTAVLLARQKEPPGYGLYSYALLFHPPSAAELPRYQAFLKALVDLPTAQGLAQYVAKDRINVTSIPLMVADPAWEENEAEAKIAFILKHYDYARSAAIRAGMATKMGAGPVLLSVLHPIDPAERPRPVLVQDMSLAQATLMSAYVQAFVSQAAQERFWQTSALSQFALGLRNSLETAAGGLGMSKDAVDSWVKFFK